MIHMHPAFIVADKSYWQATLKKHLSLWKIGYVQALRQLSAMVH